MSREGLQGWDPCGRSCNTLASRDPNKRTIELRMKSAYPWHQLKPTPRTRSKHLSTVGPSNILICSPIRTPAPLLSSSSSLPSFHFKMPLQAMTEVEINEWTDKLDADLGLQLSRSDVSRHTMATLAKHRFTSVRKFQMIAHYVITWVNNSTFRIVIPVSSFIHITYATGIK